MTTTTIKRQGTSIKAAESLVAFDMEPVAPSDVTTFEPSLLYVETGGTVLFTAPNGIVRTITVPSFFVTPFAITNVLAASTATGIHRLVQ